MNEFADLMFRDRSFIIPKTPDLMNRIETMAREIHEKPVQNRGRTLKEVTENTKCVVIENAMTAIITRNSNSSDFELNPLKHDKTNPHSYAYDVIHKPSKKTFELKRWPDDQPDGSTATWFSYPRKSLETFQKNIGIIDYLVGAKLIEYEDEFEVGFHMIADAKTFMDNIFTSKYNPEWQIVYDHNKGKCLVNRNVKYRNQTSWNSDTQYQYSKSA
jgi:hypothetical protein